MLLLLHIILHFPPFPLLFPSPPAFHCSRRNPQRWEDKWQLEQPQRKADILKLLALFLSFDQSTKQHPATGPKAKSQMRKTVTRPSFYLATALCWRSTHDCWLRKRSLSIFQWVEKKHVKSLKMLLIQCECAWRFNSNKHPLHKLAARCFSGGLVVCTSA